MRNMTVWNPTRDAMSLRQAMDRLLEDSFVWGSWPFQGNGSVQELAVDAYGTDDEIVVTAALPGVKADEVEITVEGDTLTIRGETPARLEDVSYIFAERFHGSFSRMLRLNVPVDVSKVQATFADGILTVTLPKADEVKPKSIKIKAK